MLWPKNRRFRIEIIEENYAFANKPHLIFEVTRSNLNLLVKIESEIMRRQ